MQKGSEEMADRTKKWIAEAMKKLLQKKPLEKVYVTEICQEAEIERPTFYYHFKDKYDLMAWIFFQSAVRTDVLSVESAAASMEDMRREYTFYKRAYEDTSQNAMWSYMLEYFDQRYSRLAMERSGRELDAQTRFSIRLYCYGAVGMTREWLLNDKRTEATTVVERMFRSMPDFLQAIYFPGEKTPGLEKRTGEEPSSMQKPDQEGGEEG